MMNLSRVSIPSDGDCLYHAVLKGLNLVQVSPLDLRKVVANVIKEDPDLYDDLVREWKDFHLYPGNVKPSPYKAAKKIELERDWATSTCIHILSLALECRINVFELVAGKYIREQFPSEWKGYKKFDSDTEIFLYKDGNHFELLSEKEEPPKDSSRRNPVRHKAPLFAPLIETHHFANKYMTEQF
jgi:hypothetical protein